MTAQEIIKALNLAPHPEGGWFRETHRATVDGSGRSDTLSRPACTAIYFLIERSQSNRWHKVDAVELWLWHAGSDLELSVASGNEGALSVKVTKLGTSIDRSIEPQGIVPARVWQSVRTLGEWTLVSCVVAPGFEWSGFTLAPEGWTPVSTST